MLRQILVAGVFSILPTMVQAQGRAILPGGSRPATAASRALTHMAQPVGTLAAPGTRMVARTGTSRARTAAVVRNTRRAAAPPRSLEADDTDSSSDFIPVPGLGFDMAHLAATRGAAAVGGRHQRGFPLFFPFLDGGFFLPSSPSVPEESAPADSQQSEDREAEAVEAPRRTRSSRPAQTAEVEAASPAPRQPEEFVFVRRDGTVFFAVAYAWETGTLRYITSEGFRRTLARDALDLNATQQFNEQRGMNFRLPA